MAKGLCTKCGEPTQSKQGYCRKCANEYTSNLRANWTQEKIEEERQKAKLRWAKKPLAYRQEAHKKWKAGLSPEELLEFKQGRRLYAKEQRRLRPKFFEEEDKADYGTTKLCLKHWIDIITRAGNRRCKTHLAPADILALWNSQKDACAVTGLKLIPGINAHLDHIIPRAKGGKHEIGNLRFVHETFNRMKDALLDSEVKEFLRAAIPAFIEWIK